MKFSKFPATAFVFAFFFSLQLLAQPYDGKFGVQKFSDKIVQAGNGFVMASFNPAGNGFEIIKFSNLAELRWKRTHITTLNSTTLTMMNTFWRGVCEAKSGFFLAGIGFKPAQPGIPARWELCVIKTNQKGNQVFIKRHILLNQTQTPIPGIVGEVVFNPNKNEFLVVGQLGQNMYAAKLKDNGDLIWQKNYGPGFGWTAVDHPSTGYLIAGGKHLWKIDENGDVDWEQDIVIDEPSPAGNEYTTADRERILSIQTNGYAIMGTAYEGMYSSIYLARFDWNNGQTRSKVYAPTLKTAMNNVSVAISNFVCLGPSFYMVYNDVFVAPAPNTATLSTGNLKMMKTDLNGNIQAPAADVGNPTQVKFGDFTYKNLKFAYGNTSIANEYNAFLSNNSPVFFKNKRKR